MAYNITYLNQIVADLGGSDTYIYEIDALNAICTLLGITAGHTYKIDALNAIDVNQGGSGGHKYNIDALNSIITLAGETGGYKYEPDAWAVIQQGALLNQTTVPAISGIATSLIGDTGFTIGATVNPGGAETTVSIEYGLTNAYGSTQAIVTGSPLTETGAISAALTGLAQNTLYHYRIKAVNSEGTTYSADATQTTTNVRWIIPIAGRTSGTATNGTIVISCTEDITITKTGDVTISVVQEADSIYRLHTITISCPNNGSGTVIIPDRNKVLSCGNHRGVATLYPSIDFYAGNTSTAPIVTWNLNDLPSPFMKIRQEAALANTLIATGNQPMPVNLTNLNLGGANITYTYTGAWPANMIQVSLASINLTNTSNFPNGLQYMYLFGGSINYTASAFPTDLIYVSINGGNINITATEMPGSGNIIYFSLTNWRLNKLTSAEMVTFLTSLTNRVGSLPATITINDYADYASPPQTVVDAVAALKIAKSITTVNLGQ